jgi:hypothetical protein
MDWQNQHSKNGYTTKSNPHVHLNMHQNPNYFHHRYCKINPKVHLETQKTANSQDTTVQKSNAGSITIPHLKLYYRAIKTAWYWHENRYKGQWNKIEDPDMNPHSYVHLIFNKGVKKI